MKKQQLKRIIREEFLSVLETASKPRRGPKFKKGQTVKYIVPGTSNKMKKGKITGFESTRDEDFAIIDGKTISFSHISESNSTSTKGDRLPLFEDFQG